MVDDPLFSILLPTHSRVDVIGYAVQSVLNQTVKDFELLVVGDGCPPETRTILQGFNDPRIRFLTCLRRRILAMQIVILH
ncbi:glycosyltransferase [Ochrobactrum anthropi]|nr:glycosyltransferase [Brucella anthropi]